MKQFVLHIAAAVVERVSDNMLYLQILYVGMVYADGESEAV